MFDAPWPTCKYRLHQLLMYVFERATRLDRVQRIAWESGKILPQHIGENMSPSEHKYFEDYIEALDTYNKSSCGMDLTVDLNPPKELFIEVRVKKDMGVVILPDSGEVNLQRNTVHLLRRNEVDAFIKQGIVE